MFARRDAIGVIYEVLLLVKDGSSKTRIVYQANLNFRSARRYIDLLLNKGLLHFNSENDKTYYLTEKGEILLHYMEIVLSELNELLPRHSGNTNLQFPPNSRGYKFEKVRD